MRRLSILIIPALLLIAAWYALPRLEVVPQPWNLLLPYLPYGTIAVAAFLSLHFHRGRVLFVLVLLAILYWSCISFLSTGLSGPTETTVYLLLFLLLPINITLFCFMREKGVFTVGGRLRLVFIVVQFLFAGWLLGKDTAGLAGFLSGKHLSWPVLDYLPLPQVPSFFLFLGSALMFIRVIVRKSHLDSGLLGAMVAVGLTGYWQGMPNAALVFVSSAGLILVLSLLQNTYNMAYRDELTGLQARRALNEQLSGLGRNYVIAMVDVDHFKRFNDTFGHDVGDQVLKMVASKIDRVRGGGRAFRYGGEEFTVLFPRKRADDVMHHLEDLRKSIAEYKLWLRSTDRPKKDADGEKQRKGAGGDVAVSVTVSIGVAESAERQSAAEVIKSADKALYRAKHKGRNQVCRN